MTAESVAFLFTDLVGSTALFQRLAPEAADDLRRRHFAILRQGLAESGGREVKNLGDGLMAAFASSSAALGCAVAMQQAVDRDNRIGEHSLGLRIGLSAGEVVREDGDYFGDPVIEASRLCALCEPGQILAAEVVRLTAGRRSPFDYRSVGALSLKGLSEPVHAVEVKWEPLTDSDGWRVPLPRRLALRPEASTPVVGRGQESSQLSDALHRVVAGDGREIILVAGEAGQGKTTIVAEAARVAYDTGACVLFGHCEEEVATPYQMFGEALGHLFLNADEERLRQLLATHGSEWARLVPALRARIPDLPPSKATDGDTERFLLFAAAVGILSEVSRGDPIVIVLDDLQWADSGSLALLRYLAASEHPMRVLVLGTFRDSELPLAPDLRGTLGGLWRYPGVARLDLGGLSGAGVQDLMEAMAGHELDSFGRDLAEAIHHETDGNPFFVTEMLRHLRDTGAIHRNQAGQWVPDALFTDPTVLPASVREVIDARVVRLGQKAERVLSLGAVIGRDFDTDVLERVAQVAWDGLLEILEAAEAASLVHEVDAPGRYSFSHALIQHILYDELGPTRRAKSHEQVARAIEDFCGDEPGVRVGELARHWLNAPQPGNLDRAIRYSREAADAALRSLAPADALRHYEKALELCGLIEEPDPVLLLDLAIGHGTAQRQTGDPSFRVTLLAAAQRAAQLGDVERLVAACLANNRGFYTAVGTTDHEKVEVLDMALEWLPGDHPHRALVLATLCSELAHGSTLARRQELADEAIRIAESPDDDAVVVRVFNHLHIPLQVPALLERARELTIEALARADRLGDPVLRFWSAQWRCESAARAGEMDEMDRCLAIHSALAERLDQPLFTWANLWLRSLRAQIAGDTDEAEQYATQALEVGTASGQPDAALIFGAQFNIVSGQRGTQSELVPLIEQMASETPDIPRTFFICLLAKAHVEAERFDRASEMLEEFARADFELPFDQLWLTGMVDFAEAAIECGNPAYAGPLFERLEPWAAQLPATGASALCPVSHYLGGLATVLGRYDEAERYFEQASEMNERLGAKFFGARTALLWGRMLLARRTLGDEERAHQLLQQAHEVAAAQSYAVIERRASKLLARMG